jgi:hypothetical protein
MPTTFAFVKMTADFCSSTAASQKKKKQIILKLWKHFFLCLCEPNQQVKRMQQEWNCVRWIKVVSRVKWATRHFHFSCLKVEVEERSLSKVILDYSSLSFFIWCDWITSNALIASAKKDDCSPKRSTVRKNLQVIASRILKNIKKYFDLKSSATDRTFVKLVVIKF